MKKLTPLDQTYDFFSAEMIEDIVVLKFRENLLVRAADLHAKGSLFEYLDNVSRSDRVKAVLIIGSPEKKGCEEYFEFYRKVFELQMDQVAIVRLYNAVNQFILKIMELNKIVVHADSGEVIPLFLNVSLACDYRVVADNTVFKNPCLELGLVPKGGGVFFLSKMLGRSKALEILLSEGDIPAQEALILGLVDNIAPRETLEKVALNIARGFTRKPSTTVAGIKKLLNYSMKDLRDFLEFENQVLLRMKGSADFRKRLEECPFV
ncbi:MAG TPA: enoyl-CoA hydratase/isomerase family protein [Deltaproteobacteria bacterium]|nr:enoyl-CoA hydratase/isomerase family protein [Deltaproteobacteria bacterium]